MVGSAGALVPLDPERPLSHALCLRSRQRGLKTSTVGTWKSHPPSPASVPSSSLHPSCAFRASGASPGWTDPYLWPI